MLNKAQIIGNLGGEPKVSTAQNGNQVASFSVATTDRAYKNTQGVEVPARTEWHNVVCFGKLAEITAKYLHKGAKVYIEGKMRTRSYTDKNGTQQRIMEINADQMEMLEPKSNVPGGQQPTTNP